MIDIVNVFAQQPLIVGMATLAFAAFADTAHIRIFFHVKKVARQVVSGGGFVEHLSWP